MGNPKVLTVSVSLKVFYIEPSRCLFFDVQINVRTF